MHGLQLSPRSKLTRVSLRVRVCRAMYDQTDDPVGIEPTLQVLSVKKVNPTGNVDRYR